MRKFHNFIIYIYFLLSRISNFFKLKIYNIYVSKNVKINGSLFFKGRGEVFIGENATINSSYFFNPIGGQAFTSIVVGKDAKLIIGNNVGISNSAFFCLKKITIGTNVLIGGDCKIYDTDFHSIYLKDRLNRPETGVKTKPVVIEPGAFIGTGCIILKGVTIGENSVIAAGSVVSKNIPSNEIWGGNPIQFYKKIL